MPKKKSVRLSKHVIPSRYRIMLKPNLEQFTFTGDETIYLNLTKPANKLTLHAVDLSIENVFYKKGREKIKAKDVHFSPENETATFTFEKVLPEGKGQLNLHFEGQLNDKMRGFYRSRYEINGEERYMGVTQLESTDARRVFPSFDEPAQKAIFDVTLMAPAKYEIISNTLPEVVKEHEGGYKSVKFAPTPKMSTYLLAFIVGEFEYLEDKTKDGVLVRVFTTPGKKEQGKFALDVAVKSLEFFNEYFDIDYPLPVLDLIAVPDFAAGAMENWGAITYRETALLVDPEKTSAHNKQWVALVIAHEIAHQWFGNLVTMQWWTHLWLNEGFATYIEFLAVDHIFPKWDIWTQFMHSDHNAALRLDSLANTHAIEVEVHHPNEIAEIFDAVSYQKGASIIRMLAEYLGHEDFRDGLRHYLKKHKYGNAKTEDLWAALEKVSGKPVKRIMKQWTRKPGYPLVVIEDSGDKYTLSQSRFYLSELSRKEAKDKTIWPIPLEIQRGEENRENILFDKKSSKIDKHGSHGYIKLNPGETSFIRVDYSQEELEKLHPYIASKRLSTIDRLGIVRDAFALAQSGQLQTTAALDLLRHYKNEDDFTVWQNIASSLAELDILLFDKKFYPEFEKYARSIFKPLADDLGWEREKGESHTKSLLRSLVLYRAGTYGDKAIIKEAKTRFKDHLKGKKKLTPDIRGLVYNLVAENGSKYEYGQIRKLYDEESLHEEKNRLVRALSSFKQKELLKKTLDFSLSDKVRMQDAILVVAAVWSNPHGRDLAWKFVKTNWGEFVKRYGKGGYLLARMLQSGGGFTTNAQADDFEKFFKENPAPTAQRTIQQVLEKVRSHAAWYKRDGKKIEKWLKK